MLELKNEEKTLRHTPTQQQPAHWNSHSLNINLVADGRAAYMRSTNIQTISRPKSCITFCVYSDGMCSYNLDVIQQQCSLETVFFFSRCPFVRYQNEGIICSRKKKKKILYSTHRNQILYHSEIRTNHGGCWRPLPCTADGIRATVEKIKRETERKYNVLKIGYSESRNKCCMKNQPILHRKHNIINLNKLQFQFCSCSFRELRFFFLPVPLFVCFCMSEMK